MVLKFFPYKIKVWTKTNMKLDDLNLDRNLYKNPLGTNTYDSDLISASNTTNPIDPIASGNAATDINNGSVTIDGVVITPGTIPATTLDLGNWGWTQTSIFTVTDADTISWSAGTFTSANGSTVLSIAGGNTGNMAAKTYIYLDINVSTTAYQVSTSVTDPVGLGKVLIAVCQNGATTATFALVQAAQITGDNILANTIGAGKINVGQLSAITADMGSITAGTITGALIQTAASAPRIEMSGAANAFRVYDSGNHLVAGMGTISGRAIDINTSVDTNNGIFVSDAIGGVGFYYNNTSNVAAKGIYINMSSTGANNNLSGIEIIKAGSGQGIIETLSGSARGIYMGNSGTGESLYIIDTGANNKSLYINRNKDGSCIELSQSITAGGNPIGITMAIASSVGTTYAFDFEGSEYAASAVSGTQNRKIRVLIGGNVYYIPAYDA